MEETSSYCPISLNQTAAVLLAAAVVELFPGALMVRGEGTRECFFYDFVFPFEFQKEFIPQIEEHMRLMIRQQREVRHLEMMPANAASMMRHYGQDLVAESLLCVERATAQICQIGGCAVYSPEPCLHALTIPYLKIFEAFSWEVAQKKGMRIVGAAALDKGVLKAKAKEPSVSSRSHLNLVKEAKLLEPLAEEGFWTWCPEGEALRQRLILLWREKHGSQNFSFVASPIARMGDGGERELVEAHRDHFLRFGICKIAEIALISNAQSSDVSVGLFSPKAHFVDRAHLFCPEGELLEECISSLQFIFDMLKILGFGYEIALTASSGSSQKLRSRALAVLEQALKAAHLAYTVERGHGTGVLAAIEIRIADALGRRWTGPFLGVSAMPLEKGWMLVRSVFGSLERMVALLLEQKGGRLPLLLASEQVRILVATGKTSPYVRQVSALLQAQGIRVRVEGCNAPLKARLYKAFVEKVPFVILLGEREEKEQVLTVRVHGESMERSLSIDELCMGLKCEMGSKTSELTN